MMTTKMTKTWLFAGAMGLAAIGLTGAPALAGGGSCNCASTMADKSEKPEAVEKKEKEKDLVETAAAAGSFKTLLAAAEAAGLVDVLKSEGPLTLFAPTDKAFAALPEGKIDSLLKPENKDQLVKILTYHVVPGKVDAKTAMAAGKANSVQGGELVFKTESHGDHSHAMVNGVNISKTDIKTSNGLIHVIDAVLIPESE